MFASRVHKRVVEASGESIDGCVVRVDVHIESVFCCRWMCNAVATEHGRYSLFSMQKL